MTVRALWLLALLPFACTRPNTGLEIGGDNGGGVGKGGMGDSGVIGGDTLPDAGGTVAPGNTDLAVGGSAADATIVGPSNDYGQDGPTPSTDFSPTVTRPNRLGFTIRVFVPSSAGTHGVVVLSSGLLQPASAYLSYAKRLASWNLIAILRDDPGPGTQSADVATDISYLVRTWLPSQNGDPTSPLAGKVDLARVALAGHARGAQAALLAALGDSKGHVRGVFGLDPVDTAQGNTRARDTLPQLGVPTAFLGELTDAGGGIGAQACAPSADNFLVLYAAAPSPSLALTAVGADQTQFEDPASCTYCGFCMKGSADGKTVLAYSVRYLTAFFARELLGDSHVGATLDGAGAQADVSAGLIQLVAK